MKFFDRNEKILCLKKLTLLTLLLITASCLAINEVTKVAAYTTEEILSIYLPIITKNNPNINRFGIAFNVLDSSNGIYLFSNEQANWTRRDSYWSAIEPLEGQRLWDTGFEQELIDAREANLQPIIIIESTPEWALKDGFTCGAVAENKLSALGEFAYDLVKRYSAPPYSIQYWELWNEPDAANFMGCWGDPSDPNYYGGYYYGLMLKVVYPKIKAADPDAQVLVGGLLLDCDPNNPPQGRTCIESQFLRGILESEGRDSFDGVAFHGYDYYYGLGVYGNNNWNSHSTTTGPVTIVKSKYLKELLAEYGQTHKYLITTESAVIYGPNDFTILCSPDAPSEVEVTKAYYVVHSYAATISEDWKSNIWYSALGLRCSGLLQADLTPLPAYYAFQFALQKLGEGQFIREITEYPGIKGYEYGTPGRRLWVLWSLDGKSHVITLNAMPFLITRIGEDGKPVIETNSTLLTVDLSPRFVEY